MELLIRSQSKLSLVEAKNLTIIEREGKWHIVKLNASLNIEYRIELGIYKTKERALEVLDEIQKLLEPKFVLHTEEIEKPITEYVYTIEQIKDIKELSIRVYEMPEE